MLKKHLVDALPLFWRNRNSWLLAKDLLSFGWPLGRVDAVPGAGKPDQFRQQKGKHDQNCSDDESDG